MEPVILGLQEWATEAPVALRVLVGALGAVVLLAGARLAKPALSMGAFGVGALGGALAIQALATVAPEVGRPVIIAVAACVGGVGVLIAAHLALKVALIVAGALTGLVAAAALAPVLESVGAPWWSIFGGPIVGAIALPLLATLVLRVVAAAIGAVLVAWAVGLPTHPWLLLGLFALGAVVQFGVVGGRKAEAEAD